MPSAVRAGAQGLRGKGAKACISISQFEIPLLGEMDVVALQHRKTDLVEGRAHLQELLLSFGGEVLIFPLLQGHVFGYKCFKATANPNRE